METLKFLMVTTFYPPYHLGGDAVHVRYLAEALAEKGHEVHVEFAPAAYRLKGGKSPSSLGGDGVELHPIPSPRGRAQPLASYLLGRSASVTRFHEGLLKNVRPDVVHLHNISLLGTGVLESSGPATTLYTAHDYWIRCPRSDLFKYGRYPCDAPTCTRCSLVSLRPPQLWRRGDGLKPLSKLDAVIAPSRFMMRAIEQELACPIVHIPNFAPDQNPEGRIEEPGEYYLYVGVHDVHKGVLELAQAAADNHDVQFVFVGKGRYEGRLRRLLGQTTTNTAVKGWVSPQELARYYRRARGLIVPSLWHENSPLVAIEALSWGTPLLVSDRGGLRELVPGGDAGLSFEPTSAGITLAIEESEDGDAPKRLREGARRAYEDRHHPDKYLEKYTELVKETSTGETEKGNRRDGSESNPDSLEMVSDSR